MPELPEVETIVQGLKTKFLGKKIIDVELRYEKLLRDCQGKILQADSQKEFVEKIINKRISDIRRRGKYILLHLEDFVLIIHLRMTGKFSSDPIIIDDKHTHLLFHFEDGTFLAYNDIRKFGTFQAAFCQEDYLKASVSRLGPEPLGADFTLKYLQEELAKTKKNIKAFLLSQEKIAGIGNIYADEVLFFAKVSPKRLSNSISQEEAQRIHQGIVEKLKLGIKAGGASIRNYVNNDGEKGNFQNLIQVYGKKGCQCADCGRDFITETVAGRTSTYCPCCQK